MTMTETSDPFYEQLLSTTPNSSDETSTEYYYYYEQENWLACYDYGGPMYEVVNGVVYSWDGLPIPSDVNDSVNTPIAASMILFGLIGVTLNLYGGRVVLKNNMISWAVKYYLLIDCYCRLNESFTELYKAYCVLSWDCVNPNGYPFSGLLVNMIVTSFNLGMIYSMQMIGNGLCFNRIFAVFFDGRYYSKIERIALPHGLLMWAIPCIIYCYQIGALTDLDTGFICYGCWYFTPLEYCNTCLYQKDDVTLFLVLHFDQIMYGVLGITMVLDVLTLWKVRKLRKLSESKRRADVRLSIMLVTTHFITICFLVSNYVVNNLLTDMWPIDYYLVLEVSPFLVHSILGTVVIYFNLPYKSRKPAAPATTITTLSQGNPQNKQPHHKPQTRVK